MKLINLINLILYGLKSQAIHGGQLLSQQFLDKKINLEKIKMGKIGALCKNLILIIGLNIELILSLTKHSNIFID